MNEEAAKIAQADPSLVLKGKRNLLMERAKKAVLESDFEFAKGKSRSKQASSSDSSPPTPKRKKISAEFRSKRIAALEDEIKNFEEQVKFKTKRREQAEATKSYRVCEDITEEIRCMRRMITSKNEELSELKKKDKKSLWYQRRKQRTASSSHSESEESLPSAGSTVILSESDEEGSVF